VTAIDINAAGATVSVVPPDLPETVARMAVVPVLRAVTVPDALIEATVGLDVDQDAVVVRF
jgi:hypothetical protein